MSFIDGTYISLREVERKDLETFQKIRNDYTESKYFRTQQPITEYAQEWYWINIINDPKHISFSIIEKNKSEVIGEIRVSNISYQGSEIGIIIAKEYRSKGYASESLQLFLRYIFGRTTINRIEAKIAQDNIDSIVFFERNSFVKEGVMRESTYYDFEYKDVILYSMIKKDYISKIK
jgi:RimJ/RimL family protein N-acetyltransferase